MYYKPFRFVKVLYRFDKNWLLFFINVLLVVVGYWIANIAKEAYFLLKLGRIALLLLSILQLYLSPGSVKYVLKTSFAYVVPVFGLLFLPAVILTSHPLPALLRLITILIYLFYLDYFFRVTTGTQSAHSRHFLLIEAFRVVYFLPILIYFINAPTLSETNIYGNQKDTLGLTSNNFGWAASFYFMLTVDRLKNFPNPGRFAFLDLLTLFPALYLVLISGSRSSALAIILGMVILVFTRRNISILIKGSAMLGMALLYLIIINSQDLALNRKSKRSGRSAALRKESRFEIWTDIFSIVAERPGVLLFGVGPDNSTDAINKYRHRFYKIHPHNTFIIVFFESGLFCFLWFMVYFVAKPLLQYARDDLVNFSYVIHPFLISFFDHNLGPGQFLAFPLFSLTFFYLYRSSQRVEIKNFTFPTP